MSAHAATPNHDPRTCVACNERIRDGIRLMGMRDGFHHLDRPAGMTREGERLWCEWRDRGEFLRGLVNLAGGLR